MVKVHTTLSVDHELMQKAKESLINISEATEEAIRQKLQIIKIEIIEKDKCEYCGVKMRKATRDNMMGLYWFLPDEKWICPLCDKKKIDQVIKTEY